MEVPAECLIPKTQQMAAVLQEITVLRIPLRVGGGSEPWIVLVIINGVGYPLLDHPPPPPRHVNQTTKSTSGPKQQQQQTSKQQQQKTENKTF